MRLRARIGRWISRLRQSYLAKNPAQRKYILIFLAIHLINVVLLLLVVLYIMQFLKAHM